MHGQWAEWSAWGACDHTCGMAWRKRHRQCGNPPPKFGGRMCQGDDEQTEYCEDTPACPCKLFVEVRDKRGSWPCYRVMIDSCVVERKDLEMIVMFIFIIKKKTQSNLTLCIIQTLIVCIDILITIMRVIVAVNDNLTCRVSRGCLRMNKDGLFFFLLIFMKILVGYKVMKTFEFSSK